MKYSLFIGRFQPFHEGHKTLIEKVLKEGKNVLIACRLTPKDKDNPYSYRQRRKMIKKALIEWKNQVRIISLPDIQEVCYGRKVGYGIRMIRLPKDIEEISATKIRAKL